mmetsp:Transcript_3853/g.8975  ORF Transcript_3853/g.8975 Transcript_3853/m.8975 type:complete len:225 (-) Transcript_3853:3011-3685(-)
MGGIDRTRARALLRGPEKRRLRGVRGRRRPAADVPPGRSAGALRLRIVWRHAAQALDGLRAGRRFEVRRARRADDGPRPAGAARALGRPRAREERAVPAPHDALHGRGRRTRRRRRDYGRRADKMRRRAGRLEAFAGLGRETGGGGPRRHGRARRRERWAAADDAAGRACRGRDPAARAEPRALFWGREAKWRPAPTDGPRRGHRPADGARGPRLGAALRRRRR